MSPLWVPPEYAQDEPHYHCHLCQRSWSKREHREFEGHFKQCVSDHRDAIHAASPKNKHNGIFEPWDPEWAEAQRRTGERMIREGRLVPKRNER